MILFVMKLLHFTFRTLIFYCFTVLLFGCNNGREVHGIAQKISIPVTLVSNDQKKISGQLTVQDIYGNAQVIDITYNQPTLITLEKYGPLSPYTFIASHPKEGRIDLKFTLSELEDCTLEHPLSLSFGHYLSKTVAVATIEAISGSRSNVSIRLKNKELYHIDWGDGSSQLIKSTDTGFSKTDYISHQYNREGEYSVTLRTTKLEDVIGLHIQGQVHNRLGTLKNLTLGETPNLQELHLGKNTLSNIDAVLMRLPKLTSIVLHGTMNQIDISKNNYLELLHLNGRKYTSIVGLENLRNLTFLSLNAEIGDIDMTAFPLLEHLTLNGVSIKNIDLSQNTKLTTLSVFNTGINAIDLSKNSALTYLELTANPIKNVDLSVLDHIEHLYLSMGKLEKFKYPAQLNTLKTIYLKPASQINDLEPFLNLLFKSQVAHPREKVIVELPENRSIPAVYKDKFRALEKDWDWSIVYN